MDKQLSISIKAALRMTAKESVATKLKVGTILCNKNDVIVQYGWNRAPEGFDIEDNNGNTIQQNAIHSEIDAILRTHLDDVVGSTLYCTHSPCSRCALIIKYSGVAKVRYLEEHKGSTSYDLLNNPLNLDISPL